MTDLSFAKVPFIAVAAISMLVAQRIQAQNAPDLGAFLMTDRAAEVALARTAAPRSISDSARVLVLTRAGYITAANGTNGFTCLVARPFMGAFTDPTFWNAKVRAPHCLNAPAVRTVLPQMMKRAAWIMSGASVAEVGAREKRAYATHELPLPAPGAMAYMLSPQQYLTDDNPPWKPHLMFYEDRSLPASTWGAGGSDAPIIDGSTGNASSPVWTLLIPVPKWSDGTVAK